MISLKQISKAIQNKLENVLPQLEVQSNEITEGFVRPSLFVEFSNVTTSTYISNKRERTVDIIIYYFPTSANDNEIELLDTQDILEEAFRQPMLITESFFVFPQEVSSVVSDGVLQTSFSIYLLESAPEKAGELMTDLSIDTIKINK